MRLAGMPKGSPSTLPLRRKRLRPGDDAGAPAQGETLPRSRPHTRDGRMAGGHSLKMRSLRPNTSWSRIASPMDIVPSSGVDGIAGTVPPAWREEGTNLWQMPRA